MTMNKDKEKVELQKDLARIGLDKARKMIWSSYTPAPRAVEFLEKGEECFARGDYVRALEYAVLSGDEIDRTKNP
jgi:hypothetical protein